MMKVGKNPSSRFIKKLLFSFNAASWPRSLFVVTLSGMMTMMMLNDCWIFAAALLRMFRIEEHELLGEGTFGQVFRATVKLPNANKQTVAIKRMKGRQTKQRFCSVYQTSSVLAIFYSALDFVGDPDFFIRANVANVRLKPGLSLIFGHCVYLPLCVTVYI